MPNGAASEDAGSSKLDLLRLFQKNSDPAPLTPHRGNFTQDSPLWGAGGAFRMRIFTFHASLLELPDLLIQAQQS